MLPSYKKISIKCTKISRAELPWFLNELVCRWPTGTSKLETQSGASLAGSWQWNRIMGGNPMPITRSHSCQWQQRPRPQPGKDLKTRLTRRKPHPQLHWTNILSGRHPLFGLPYPSLSDPLLWRYHCPEDRLVSLYKPTSLYKLHETVRLTGYTHWHSPFVKVHGDDFWSATMRLSLASHTACETKCA